MGTGLGRRRLTAATDSDRLGIMKRHTWRLRGRVLASLAVSLLAVSVESLPAAQLSSRQVADRGPRTHAIVGGTVHVGDGAVLEGANLVMRDGLIVAVGIDATPPPGAAVMDAAGKHVAPGLVDALGNLGLPGDKAPEGDPARGPGDRPATHADRRAADLLDLGDDRIAAYRNAGFTSAVSAPEGGIISGHAAWWNLLGEDPGDLVLSAEAALMVRLETQRNRSFPSAIMGVIAYLRQLFLDVRHYGEVRRIYEEDPTGLPRPRYDRMLAPLARAAAGSQPVLLPGNRDKEMRRMVRLAADLGIRPVLYGGHEAESAASFLAEHRASVLVDLRWPKADRNADPEAVVPLRELRLRDRAPAGPAALAAAGVRFGFHGGGKDALDAVRTAVDRGLDREAALTALTLAPAQIFGLDDRIGSLAPGRIANVLVVDRHPLDEGAVLEAVFVDGVLHRPVPNDRETDADRGENRCN